MRWLCIATRPASRAALPSLQHQLALLRTGGAPSVSQVQFSPFLAYFRSSDGVSPTLPVSCARALFHLHMALDFDSIVRLLM